MFTEREVLDLNDRILGHIGLMERFRMFSRQCPDPQVRDVVTRQQQMLQNHYQMMTGLMQNAQNMQGATSTQNQWRMS